jgi:hypothetical protein
MNLKQPCDTGKSKGSTVKSLILQLEKLIMLAKKTDGNRRAR